MPTTRKNKKQTASLFQIPCSKLSEKITSQDAVEIAYKEDIKLIKRKLSQGISTLVSCEAILINYLSNIIIHGLEKSDYILLEDKILTSDNVELQLHKKIEKIDTCKNVILILENVNILTLVKNNFSKDFITFFKKKSKFTILGFVEHRFTLPKFIDNLFELKLEIFGIKRKHISRLITKGEGKKFQSRSLNLYKLHKYTSGFNAVELRKVFSYFYELSQEKEDQVDIYEELRDMTCHSGFKLSHIELENDVAGYYNIKNTLEKEIITPCIIKDKSRKDEEIREIEEFIPKGVLFSGPPGVGKIYFAKALANKLGAVYKIVSSPELKSKWEVDGKTTLRHIFSHARKCAPSIIVFDKLDAFASVKKTYQSSGVEHSMLMQLISEMENIRKEEMVFLLGTTNFLSSIDPALLRAGRFELHIPFSYPNKDDRRYIMQFYSEKFQLNLSTDQVREIVQRTSKYLSLEENVKFSTDNIFTLSRFLKRRLLSNRRSIDENDIDDALAIIGKYKRKIQLSQEEKWRIAVHEAGHCLLSRILQYIENIEVISISTTDADFPEYKFADMESRKLILSKEALFDRVCLCLAGRVAEEIALGDTSTNALFDLDQATNIAQDMVEIYGMGIDTGIMNYRRVNNSFPGERHLSLRSKNLVDREIQNIIQGQNARAQTLINQNRNVLNMLSAALLDQLTLRQEDLTAFFEKYPLTDE